MRLHLATLSGYFRLEQSGKKWVLADRALSYWSMTSISADPSDPSRLYLGTEHSGLFQSEDGGLRWKRAQPNVPRLMISSLHAGPAGLLVGTVPAALYRATAESDWEELEDLRRASRGSDFPPNPDLGPRTRCLASDPFREGRLYAGIEVGGMLASDDGGLQWSAANRGLTDPDVHQVLASARTAGTLVAACGEGVFRSPDHGGRWEEVTPPGPRNYGTAVGEDREGNLYLGVALGRPNTWVREEKADAAILVSRDGGVTWKSLLEKLGGGVMDLCGSPDGEGVFGVTSEGEVYFLGMQGNELLAKDLPCINGVMLSV